MTNQEKHNKIYELTGIEPKLWCGNDANDSDQEVCDIFITIKDRQLCDEASYDLYISEPHYPCEQLWGMLPKEIEIANYIRPLYLIAVTNCIRYEAHSRDSSGIHKETKGGLQTALLDMVLWCIEKEVICKKK